ncbi:hypothetical protein AKJ57_03890 [candidate division MSBL1 archaeon SCGC-AAA259A05]|uniref:Carbohydrate kinase PfkB domain-containing protein n=1 Tax=candidate division MSBL1 archaeon SCGC-AAA259A05 TaxID=1698259 RepID=A0A133U986_9EURY|nr:hypothetical protein AKJ57_03890 [candidate division MSBL1 archaeon SCGC-AAA259A05]
MSEVLTVGEILVEIMRKEVDVTLEEKEDFVGPFPSGAPTIFVDAVARLGVSSGIIGGLGKDEFAECILERLEDDGVDTSMIKRSEDLSTGVAFVTYFSDGSRKFIYHMENSAAGIVGSEDVKEEYLDGVTVVHVNGCSLTMGPKMRGACYRVVDVADDRGILISFDPNVRIELEAAGESRNIISPILEVADVVTPSMEETEVITGSKDTADAAEFLLDKGIGTVAIKKGDDGCELYRGDEALQIPPYDVKEVDPTGAGDAFSAGMVVGLLEDMELERLGNFANAVGARAVTAKGPMEGLAKRGKIDEMVSERI